MIEKGLDHYLFFFFLAIISFIALKIRTKQYHKKWENTVSLPNYIQSTNQKTFSRKISPIAAKAQDSFFSTIFDQCSFYYEDRQILEYITLQYTEYFIRNGHIQEERLDALLLYLYRYGIMSAISKSPPLSSDLEKADMYMRRCEYCILHAILRFMEEASVGFLPARSTFSMIDLSLDDPRFHHEEKPFSYIFNQQNKHNAWKNLSLDPNYVIY